MPEIKEVEAIELKIYIAGDYEQAREACRYFAYHNSICVTCTKTSYIYVGGEEEGVIVGLINYPRFPTTREELWSIGTKLAESLRLDLFQLSFTVTDGLKTRWTSYRDEHKPAR